MQSLLYSTSCAKSGTQKCICICVYIYHLTVLPLRISLCFFPKEDLIEAAQAKCEQGKQFPEYYVLKSTIDSSRLLNVWSADIHYINDYKPIEISSNIV